MKKTLIDVSKKTGYSISTISRVLNGKSEKYRISQSARDVILQTVKELDYQPDIVAQSLRNNTTYTIGLLVPHIDNPFFANIASVVIREAQNYNYTVMLIDTLEDPVQENKAIDSLLSRKIDGIILVPTGENPSKLEEISSKTPIILIDRYFENHKLPYVSTDNYVGAYQATKLLLESGHSRILCIQGPCISITTKERVRGYLDALQEAECLENAMVKGHEFSIQNGYIETELALSSVIQPTAIFALSSTILLGAIKALNEHKVRVPQDMSIISFDDNLYLDYLNPPVTRIAQPLENIGIIAVKMLMQKILEETELHTEILLKPTIIKRDSIRVLNDRM
ncbi:LacI family DNA-binding transcriptional regulator [uncultured Bacteroides sp.]|uniref:LacI family DNA-binding transcriptional regulator n=1 Tax=uncultured Bacteroides sp. TaxID=162156 RepID=UPI0025FE9A0B|nr:LacI family DNA-binding transcriptional regulator [uncultured Bacteroides sp.]